MRDGATAFFNFFVVFCASTPICGVWIADADDGAGAGGGENWVRFVRNRWLTLRGMERGEAGGADCQSARRIPSCPTSCGLRHDGRNDGAGAGGGKNWVRFVKNCWLTVRGARRGAALGKAVMW